MFNLTPTQRIGASCAFAGPNQEKPQQFSPRHHRATKPARRSTVKRDIAQMVAFCVLTVLLSPIAHAAPVAPQAAAPADAQAAEFFETKIRPLLVAKCVSCHGAAKQRGGLRLDTKEGFLKGNDAGPMVEGKDPAKSRLMHVLSYDHDIKMPPSGKLPTAEIEAVATWIKMGAVWPDAVKPTGGAATAPVFDLAKRKGAHWAWKPIVKAVPPKVKDRKWPKSPIDSFILARLEKAGLKPAPPADKRTLIRRAYFDVVGLPPTAGEVEAFVAETSPKAYEKVVDHLLASPHFGEKWARHWMDLVHYAETRGHEFDYAIPNAWQYRDYLIRAYNADVPYDQFLTEHLAGDLMEKPRLNPADGGNESILGTGFWFLGEEVHSPVDIRQDETDRMATRVDTMTKTFLGLTVACARCHDHKFDAISTKDFYALNGFLLSGTYRQTCFQSSEPNRKIAEKLAALQSRAGSELLKQSADMERPVVEHLGDYLMAAREAIIGGAKFEVVDGKPGQEVAEEVLPRIAEIAAKKTLDPKVLVAWVKALLLAQNNPQDALYTFAKIAGDQSADNAAHFAERLKAASVPPPAAPSPLQVVVDYSKAGPEAWLSDGFTFGLRATRPGDVVLSESADQPLAEVVSRGSAWRDAAWNGLKLTEGSERDPGALGEWQRPGRVLRTPKVTLQAGKLFYLVRGAGRAYASVDSHLVVVGPLHGRVLTEWDTKGTAWKWVSHDLTPYKGQRVEVEFSPKTPDGELAIAMVVEANQEPPLPWQPNALVQNALADGTVNSPATLAAAYQRVCNGVMQSMKDGRFAKPSTDNATLAEMANWMVRNPDLFAAPHTAARQQVAEAAQGFLQERAALIQQIKTTSQSAPAMFEGNGVDENLLKRGSSKLADAEVPRRFLEALGGSAPGGYGSGSGRLTLARQMLQRDNPFTARVMANRVWYQLFGTGIVPTVDNFGVLGQTPSHPELLDYLADDFRSTGWSVKGLIRKIMLSGTYRMSSQVDAKAEELDPQDVLLHRMPVRRLPAEAIRDAILEVSGRLDATILGAPVEVNLTPFMDGRGKPGSSGPLDGAGRRSIYIKVRRNFLSPMLLAYDMPIPFATVGRRSVSNVPAQALILMNDPFVVEQAKLWAKRVLATPNQTPEQRISAMYLTAFARPPLPQETADALAFLDGIGETYGVAPEARRTNEQSWADLAHVLFNVKEFVFVR